MSEAALYADKIYGWMTGVELEWIERTASGLTSPARWVELGVWRGRSWACAALSLPKRSTIVAVDTFDGGTAADDEEIAAYLRTCGGSVLGEFLGVAEKVRAMRPDLISVVHQMTTTVAAAHTEPDGTADVVFVDADHHTDKVVSDLTAWAPKLKPGGLLCGHDYTDKRVQEALRSFAGWRFAFVPDTSIWTHRVGVA